MTHSSGFTIMSAQCIIRAIHSYHDVIMTAAVKYDLFEWAYFTMGEVVPNNCSMWFIGLVFEKTNLNVDLTYDISQFTKQVHYQAENTNMLREGMTIEARHVRRKQLHQYLSPVLLKRERTVSGAKRKPGDPPHHPPHHPSKKTKRLSESSTDEVSVLSYNEDSNSSHVFEVQLQNGHTRRGAPGSYSAPPPHSEPNVSELCEQSDIDTVTILCARTK
ncbi:poly(A) polymerase putative RNA binding domain-containing protein [Phthorimaea operculella]|nr:poly(A) polymerase putative RNA binding domain-containing protein [Phthorimaea operculella]